jgi:predicted ATPase/DNA-binding CsgD family transcriptional regulator
MTTVVGLMLPDGFPQKLTSFVGREADMVEVNRLLRAAQLLTLAGPPGVGKTRMAMELAEQRIRAGKTDVVLLGLDDGASGSVPEKLERVFAADATPRVRGARPPSDRLVVLNDCDQVLEECSRILSQCLPSQPRLQVLVTSREALRLPGEIVYTLAGLSLPTPMAAGSAVEHLRSDTVKLFTDRARAVDPAFCLTDRNADTVGRICAKLDGLPLAIELAARFIRVFSLAELADRLDDRLSTLLGGWRIAVERHLSWRAAVAWGYELLDPSEQELFRNVSIFPDGFAVNAVAAISGRAGDDPVVLASLVALEAKSLISTTRRSVTAPTRFRILDSIRCYGQERLAEAGEQALAGARLVEWVTDMVLASLEPVFPTMAQVREIGEERDNIRMALRLVAGRDDERQLPMVAALVAAEAIHGECTEDTRDTIRRVMNSTDEGSAYRYLGVEAAATLAVQRKDNAAELRLTEQAVALGRATPGRADTVRLMLKLSLVQDVHGDQRSSLASLEECRALNQLLGDERVDALCRSQLAWLHFVRGNDEASQLIELALPVLRERGPLTLASHAMNTAGAIAIDRDDPSQAAAMFLESLRNRSHYPHTTACALAGLGIAAIRHSRFEWGLRIIAAAEELDGFGLRTRGWWSTAVPVARAAAARLTSRAQYDSALAAGRAMSPGEAVRSALAERSGHGRDTAAGIHPLSQREWQVVTLLTQGLTNRQIAARMYLSVRTVETHVRNIRDALGLRSRTHVAAWAIENSIQRPRDALFASLAAQAVSELTSEPEGTARPANAVSVHGSRRSLLDRSGPISRSASELSMRRCSNATPWASMCPVT